MKHKHAELIHAWADGAQIQYQDTTGRWWDIEQPTWYGDSVYRIKPAEPKFQVGDLVRIDRDQENYVCWYPGAVVGIKEIRMPDATRHEIRYLAIGQHPNVREACPLEQIVRESQVSLIYRP